MRLLCLSVFLAFIILFAVVGCSDDDSPTNNEFLFRVVSVDPHSNQNQVPTDATITVVFNDIIDTLSLEDSTVTLASGTTGSISCDEKTLTFVPDTPLDSNSTHQVRISGTLSGVNGGSLGSNYTWSFKTVDGAGYNWFASPDSVGDVMKDIVWGDNKFVMVGCSTLTHHYPLVYTSTDGIRWTKQPPPENALLTGVTYFKNRYIAIAVGGKIFVSNTGESWSQVNTDFSSILESIAASDSIAVATSTGVVYTSTDGETWTAVDPQFDGWIGSICWTGSMFVAGTEGDTIPHILTSPNGTDWTDIPLTGHDLDMVELYGVAASNDRIVAVGPHENLFTSEDGVIWTRRDLGIPDGEEVFLVDVIWGGDRFVVVGGSHLAWGAFSATSYDGITWQDHNYIMSNGAEFKAIGWSGTKFVVSTYRMDKQMFYSPE